jgi:hypothetical protein
LAVDRTVNQRKIADGTLRPFAIFALKELPMFCFMRRRIAVAACLFASLSAGVLAQSAPPTDQAAPSQPAAAGSDVAESMEPPMVGDHWTYEVRDEITGELKNTLSSVITEVTPTDIAVRVQNQAYSQGPSVLIYDHFWNVKNNPTWRFSPNDGTGIKTPLAVGNAWHFSADQLRSGYGFTFKTAGTSKVVGTESMTTDAGTFQALKIETSINGHNANDPSKRFETTMTTWYVPSLDHWVKRTVKAAFNGEVHENDSLVLVDYGRR